MKKTKSIQCSKCGSPFGVISDSKGRLCSVCRGVNWIIKEIERQMGEDE